MDEAQDTIGIYQKVAAKLVHVAAVDAEFLAAQDGFGIVAQIVPTPGMQDRTLQIVRLVSSQIRIEEEGKGGVGFFQPHTGPIECAERDGDNLNLPGGKFRLA